MTGPVSGILAFFLDVYLSIWELLFSIPVYLRACIVFLFIAVLSYLLITKILPAIFYGVIFIINKMVGFIIEYIFLRLENRVIMLIRKDTDKTPGIILGFDKLFTFILQALKTLVGSVKKVRDLLQKKRRKIRTAFVWVYILFLILILLSYTDILRSSRMNKYADLVKDTWNSFQTAAVFNNSFTERTPANAAEAVHPAVDSTNAGKPAAEYFRLNKTGINGSTVRENPRLYDSRELEVVSGDAVLEYLDESQKDKDGRIWYKIKTPKGIIGWISGKLVEKQ